MIEQDWLDFKIPKYLIKQIEKLEERFNVNIIFEDVYGLECKISDKDYIFLKEFIVWNAGEMETKSQKSRTFKEFVERFLEDDIRNIPQIELTQFIKRVDADDFKKGNIFWIGERKFEVLK